jgi:hypothetical protein
VLVSEVIDRTYLEWLNPSGIDRPAFDFLATNLTATGPASFNVTGRVTHIPPDSVIEIGSELILLADADVTNLTPAERGYYNTIAAVHAIGDMVRIDPKYPRATLFNFLVSLIGMLRPWGLYWRDVDTTKTFTSRSVLALPAGGERILSVLVRDSGSLETYTKLTREGRDWILYREFDPSKYQMRRGGPEDAQMRVVYTKDFTEPASEATDLDDCGVPSSIQPYLPLGVAGMALQGRELPRVQIEEIRRQLASAGVQVGTALNIGQAILRTFRLDYVFAERRRQSEDDPLTYTWARTE